MKHRKFLAMCQSARNETNIREKLVAFLEARNASRTMLDATSVIPPIGQIEVPDGVIFSQRETIEVVAKPLFRAVCEPGRAA